MKPFSSRPDASISLLGLATFVLLGLAAAPAHAQTLSLNSGDNLAVSGAGTVGTLGGKAVSNTTSFYSFSGGSSTVQTSGTSTFTLANGGSISSGQSGQGLYDVGSGAVSITGGSITGGQFGTAMAIQGSGPVTISGGTIRGTSGSFSNGLGNGTGLYITGSGPVTITGGTFATGENYFGGGTVLDAKSSGPITVTGGIFTAGHSGYGLQISNSTLNLFSFGGTPFLVDGVAMNNTTLNGSQFRFGSDTISGILANGDVLNTRFQDQFGIINLNIGTPPAAVPEASTTVSLGLLLMLGLGGIAFAARRKSAV